MVKGYDELHRGQQCLQVKKKQKKTEQKVENRYQVKPNFGLG